jgi:hypothetical protein
MSKGYNRAISATTEERRDWVIYRARGNSDVRKKHGMR